MKKMKGFTLIELLVVVIIIGILAAIGIPQYTKTVEKSQRPGALSGIGIIMKGEAMYYAENDKYTTTLSDLDTEEPTSSYWDFTVTTGATDTKFYVKALRHSGKCANSCIIQDYCGTIADENGEMIHDVSSTTQSCSDAPTIDINGLCVCTVNANQHGWLSCSQSL